MKGFWHKKKIEILIFPIVMVIISCSGPSNNLKTSVTLLHFDKYGGLSDLQGNNASGFFRAQLMDNRWVFVDPDNHIFFSVGADGIRFSGAGASPFFGFSQYTNNLMSIFPSPFQQYTKLQWVQETINRYKELGFNTLGNWSENGLTVFYDTIPYTVPMNFLSAVTNDFGSNNCPVVNKGFWTDFPDVYDPRFTQDAYAYARQTIMPGFIDDPWLIGYFPDNEISWFGGAQFWYNPDYTLADDYIALPSTYAGKQYWVNAFLRQKLGYTLNEINRLYGTTFTSWMDIMNITNLPNNQQYPQIQADKQAFIYDIASTYFSVTNGAIKSVDPNHLNLCSRFASYAPDQVVQAASNYCDVISVNDYYALDNTLSDIALGDPVKRWSRMFELTMINNPEGKPFIQSEFGIRGDDAGLPDSKGAGWTVRTQNERAQYYRDDINRLLGIKISGVTFMAGFHWFEWADEPATGRFDGENSNYGLVNIKDEQYTTVFDSMANTVRTLMYILDHKNPPVLNPPDSITATMLRNDAINLSWSTVPGADTYEVIVSPYRTMPSRFTMRFTDITSTQYTLPYSLPQGIWWFGVKALGQNNIQSDFSTLTGFTVNASMNNSMLCMDMTDLGCFTNNITDTFPNPDNAVGDGVVVPEEAIKDTAVQSAMIGFTLNSLALQAGLPVSAIVTLGMNEIVPITSSAVFSFDVYPDSLYTPSGLYRSATDFVYLRLILGNTILYDAPLPQSLPVYTWSTIAVSLSGMNVTGVTPEFYVDAHAKDIPYDQRIVFYLDNIND